MEIVNRDYNVDIFRLIASFFIVFLHVGMENADENVVAIIRTSGRWAVPFFFLVSGYFFQKSLLKGNSGILGKSCGKIFNIWVVANIIYIVVQYAVNGNFDWKHVFPGAYFHLWFLPSLILGTVVIYYFNKVRLSPVITLGISALIILLVLLADSYSAILHLEHGNLSGKVIPLLSIPFMTIGTFFLRNERCKSITNKRIGILLVVFGFALQLIEIWLINIYTGRPMSEHQYLFGTFFLSIGIFILSLSVQYHNKTLGIWGRNYSLFIYLYHPLIIIICYQTSYKALFYGNLILVLPIVIALTTFILAYVLHNYFNFLFLMLNGSFRDAFSFARGKHTVKRI